jgi:hypothetical protein
VSVAELRVLQRRGTVALGGRETRRMLSLWTQTILPPVLTALLFLVIFGGALGARIHRIEGVRYVMFILPGLLVMTAAGQAAANAATSLFQAKNEGYIEDLLTAPLRPWQIRCLLPGRVARARVRRPPPSSPPLPLPSPAASIIPASRLLRSAWAGSSSPRSA